MKKTLFFTLAILFGTNSWAASCRGVVEGVTVAPNGQVYFAKLGNWEWLSLCSVSQDYNGVKADSCKSVLSVLLAAQMSKKEVEMWVNEGDCSASSQTPWQPIVGWYFGPRID